jgi:hypothetical protein
MTIFSDPFSEIAAILVVAAGQELQEFHIRKSRYPHFANSISPLQKSTSRWATGDRWLFGAGSGFVPQLHSN